MFQRFFRRKSNTDGVELKEDYPAFSDTDAFSEDERQRQEWIRHLNRQAAIPDGGQYSDNYDENFEYESEYNYSFGSDSSIINAFKEKSHNDSPRVYTERDLETQIEQVMRKEFYTDGDGQRRHGSVPSSEDSRQIAISRRPRNHSYQAGPANRHCASPTQLDVFTVENKEVRDNDRRQNLCVPEDRWERFNTGGRSHLSPVSERVKQFEQTQVNRRASYNQKQKYSTCNSKPRRENYNYNTNPWKNPGKKKVRKQLKQRKRARNLDSELSDDGEGRFSVNMTMDDLNDLIKKNINSAVKTLASEKSKSKRRLSRSDSFSTETETIFSGSSSHSTEIPSGLLQKQMKAQLDKDKLRGIIKNAVAKEASNVLQSLNASAQAAGIPQINEIPPTPSTSQPSPSYIYHYGNQQHSQTGPQYVTSAPMLTSQIPPAPPPPPPPPPLQPSVTFSTPSGIHSPGVAMYPHADSLNIPHNNLRRHSACGSFDSFQELYNTNNNDTNFNLYHAQQAGLPQGAINRLQSRRHTLAALDMPPDLSSIADDKMEQFSNALKLLDKTIRKAEGGAKTDDKDTNETDKSEASNTTKSADGATSTPDPGQVPGGVLAPFQSITDQIAILSKKKEKPLKVGQIPMSSCARTFLIITNLMFLIVGGGLVGLGVWMMTDPSIETYFNILNVDQSGSSFKLICYALIAVGAFAFLIAFLGCCGSINKSKCLLTMFLIMVSVLTVLELGLGVMVLMGKESVTAIPVLSSIMSDMEDHLKSQLKLSLVKQYLPDTMIGKTWDMLQIQLECCGALGPDDYKYSRWKNETRPETDYPDTCCVLMSKDAEIPEPSNKLLCHFGTAGFFFEEGCYEKMVGWFKDNSVYIVGASGAVIVMEIIGFVSALMICRKGVKQKAKDSKKQVPNKS